MKIYITKLLVIIAFCITLITIISVNGCVSDTGYKKITITRENIRCSFAYPSSYSQYDNSYRNEDMITLVLRYLPDSKEREADREIRIDIFSSDSNSNNTSVFTDEYLEKQAKHYQDFKLHTRSTIQVSGINCEMVVFSEVANSPSINSDNLKRWQAHVGYKGFIWILELCSNADTVEGAEEEFQHFINTFKFLE